MIIRQSSTMISCVTVLLLAGAIAFVPSSDAQQPQGSAAPALGSSNDPSGLSNNELIPTPNYSPADATFVQDTLRNNQTQVEMSQLALQKASSDDVKDFGRHMIQIHTQLNQQLSALAKHMQVDPNEKPTKQQKKDIAQLGQLSGPDFDTAYLLAMAKEQEQSIKQFKSQETGKNPNIQKVAKLDEPVLSQHYQTLQKIGQAHNVTIANVE
jgi:putative membrane protein